MRAIDLFQCLYLFFRTQVTFNAPIFVFKLHIFFFNFWMLVLDQKQIT